MTNDLVERVARLLQERLLLSNPPKDIARDVIAECFRLRDMKDAPRDVPLWLWYEGSDVPTIGHVYDRRSGGIGVSSGYVRGDIIWRGWLPLPEVKEMKK